MEPWRLNVEETDREYVVRAEVPGFAPNEIEVRLTGDVLSMRAEHTELGADADVASGNCSGESRSPLHQWRLGGSCAEGP